MIPPEDSAQSDSRARFGPADLVGHALLGLVLLAAGLASLVIGVDASPEFERSLDRGRALLKTVAVSMQSGFAGVPNATPEGAERPSSALDFLAPDEAWGPVPGERVRSLARQTLAPLLSLSPSQLRVVSDGGIPRLRASGDFLPVDLSLSRHGRLVACAWRGGS